MKPTRELPDLSLRVPATSANLGPGFDMFGIALDLYTTFEFQFVEQPGCRLRTVDGEEIPIPPERNLVLVAYLRFLEEQGLATVPGLEVTVDAGAPRGRGFGSSASALVAGLGAARQVLQSSGQKQIAPERELELLTEIEGHPDNIAPALLGGFVFSYERDGGGVGAIRRRLPEDLGLVALIPDFTISTRQSRGQLPAQLTRSDCLRNMRGVLLWMEYLSSGDPKYLEEALQLDRIHQPTRARLIPGFDRLQQEARQIGLYGVSISGSGPALLAYYPRQNEQKIRTNLASALSEVYPSPEGALRFCRPDYEGLLVMKGDPVPGAAAGGFTRNP
ncbi:MAG: homoserine kinase [Leptospiraceae bacterium]|nr:homoserine kinase [Leptospiraceae bacterium]